MSFEIGRSKKLFCQKYIYIFLSRHCILENIDKNRSNQRFVTLSGTICYI